MAFPHQIVVKLVSLTFSLSAIFRHLLVCDKTHIDLNVQGEIGHFFPSDVTFR